MSRVFTFLTLIIAYGAYSGWVYTRGTATMARMSSTEANGKQLFESHNCQSCHQLFGLGGYLGPELTTVISDRNRGPLYAKALLQGGGSRMPNFHFNTQEIDALIAYLTYVDRCSGNYKNTANGKGS